MSDIVERLRAAAAHPDNQHGPHEWLTEAAAEIERLRKRVERWKAVKEIAEGVGNELVREERARLAEAVNFLRWLNLKGGLGLEVHDRITDTIAKLEGR